MVGFSRRQLRGFSLLSFKHAHKPSAIPSLSNHQTLPEPLLSPFKPCPLPPYRLMLSFLLLLLPPPPRQTHLLPPRIHIPLLSVFLRRKISWDQWGSLPCNCTQNRRLAGLACSALLLLCPQRKRGNLCSWPEMVLLQSDY